MAKTLYDDVKAKADAAGFSMKAVCIEAGVSSGTPSHWKSERTAPNEKTYNRMIAAIDKLIVKRAEKMKQAGIKQAA